MADNTCQSEYCNAGWGEVLTHMSPYGYANFGIAFGLGLSVVGAAWGIWLTGSSLVGAAVKAPRIRSKNLIRCVTSVARGPRGRYRDAVAAGRRQKSGDGMGEAKRGPHGGSTFPPEDWLGRLDFAINFDIWASGIGHRTQCKKYLTFPHRSRRAPPKGRHWYRISCWAMIGVD